MESQSEIVRESKVWFEGDSTRGTLPRPNELVKRHEAFFQRIQRDSAFQENPPASTKAELLLQLEAVRVGDDQRSAVQSLQNASAAKDEYDTKRRRGIRRRGKWVVQHLGAFAEFVEKFSKIVEVVSSAGGPYGTAAYQTLSILLSLCVKKVKNDNQVVELFDELRSSMPRLESWESIYPTDTMQKLVAEAYVQIIDFARKAAEYLSKFWRRLVLAAMPGLAFGFGEIAGGIRNTLTKINAEALYRLHERSQETQILVAGSGKTIDELKAKAEAAEEGQRKLMAQNQELLERNRELHLKLEYQQEQFDLRTREEDARRLQAFETLLRVEHPHSGSDMESTKKVLVDVFPDFLRRSPHVSYTNHQQMSRSLLYESREYCAWRQADESSLLYLAGSTEWYGRSMPGYVHSWLSPAAIYMAEDLRVDKQKVAFFSCLPGLGHGFICPGTLLSSLILQVLAWRPEILRENDERFRRLLVRSDSTWSLTSLAKVLEEALAHAGGSGDNSVYLILDRLDRCCGSEKTLWELMECFAGIVTRVGSPDFRVKIAVVAETTSGNGTWRDDWLSKYDFNLGRVYSSQGWDQRRLTTQESSQRDRPQIWSHPSAMSAMTV